MKVTLVLIVIFLITSVFCQCPEQELDCDGDGTAEYCPSVFRDALIDLYNNFDGDNWGTNSNWDLLPGNPDACAVGPFGLTCSGSCPTEINLKNNSLSGLFDTFTTITDLVPVTTFSFRGNQLNGDLTAFFTMNIISLDLGENVFFGTLPTPPSTLTSASFDDNFLFGALPSFSGCTVLTELYLADNDFNSIPTGTFANSLSLKTLDLSGNVITGDLPSDIFCSGRSYTEVWFSGNQFSGFPTPCLTPSTFTKLHIDNNILSGSIPNTFIVLQSIDASFNNLGPSFPDYYSDLDSFNLSHNDFRSPFPPSIRSIPVGSGASFNLTFNDFDCPLPDWCSSDTGNGNCEPCNTCFDIIPGTLQNNLTLCDPYINKLTQNPEEAVRVSNSTDFEYVTTLYGGSFTVFYNLVPNVYYTFSVCYGQNLPRSQGFDSVMVLKDPHGNLIGSNDRCSPCRNGASEINYLHPAGSTFSSLTLSVFVSIQSAKSFSCNLAVDDRRAMKLYQKVTYDDAFPVCTGDYSCDIKPAVTRSLTYATTQFVATAADFDQNSYYCGFSPSINQTVFNCDTRGINYVELSFYDYSCVSEVSVITQAPEYFCLDDYILAEFNSLCTPHGCNLNIYDFALNIYDNSVCPAQTVNIPDQPFYAYLGDVVDYHLFYHDYEHGVTEVVCTLSFFGLRIIDILDETEIDTKNIIFDISIDFALPFSTNTFSPFIVSVNDYDPKSSTYPDSLDIKYLTYKKTSLRAGGVTLENMNFAGITEGSYYLMVYARDANTNTYLSIGNPIVYFYTSS